jgi:triphosphatase
MPPMAANEMLYSSSPPSIHHPYSIKKNGSSVELTLDRGKFVAPQLSAPICEVELELKRGKANDLFSIAYVLEKTASVQRANKSKADRGYAMLSRETGRGSSWSHCAVT